MARTVRELLTAARERWPEEPTPPPRRELGLLLARTLGWSEARLLARDETPVAKADEQRFLELVTRRLAGEPVAYLLGAKEFYGRDFEVDGRVLVPRPETEHLVEAALDLALPPAPRILDVGTGSGCLAVTLALELPGARAVATDVSRGALEVAARNAKRLGAGGRVHPVVARWTRGVRLSTIDLVVSNPPYLTQRELDALPRDVADFEPAGALRAGEDGLDAFRVLFAELGGLRTGTPVVCEVGRGQSEAVAELAAGAGFAHRRTVPDLAGIPRVVIVVVNRQ